jgi:hypothetical protein
MTSSDYTHLPAVTIRNSATLLTQCIYVSR